MRTSGTMTMLKMDTRQKKDGSGEFTIVTVLDNDIEEGKGCEPAEIFVDSKECLQALARIECMQKFEYSAVLHWGQFKTVNFLSIHLLDEEKPGSIPTQTKKAG